jgi:hypothetical protein
LATDRFSRLAAPAEPGTHLSQKPNKTGRSVGFLLRAKKTDRTGSGGGFVSFVSSLSWSRLIFRATETLDRALDEIRPPAPSIEAKTQVDLSLLPTIVRISSA